MGKQAILEKAYGEKIEILKSVFSEYNKAKDEIELPSSTYQSPLFIKESHDHYGDYEHQLLRRISKIYHYKEYVEYIDQQLLYLSETERLIIQHDFIKKSSKHWWESYFSSATYYRHKRKAVERLISLLFS